MAKRILLVENEKNLARFVTLELQKEAFLLDVVETGSQGLALARENDYDLFLLNYDLQDMTASEFARQLSLFKPASVIIVLASREEIKEHADEIQRFAVSYTVKPFIISDLVEKVSDIFRGRDFIDQHCSKLKTPTAYRNLRVDLKNHIVYRGEEVIALTRREYDLLVTLMSNQKVMSREQLLERVWKYEGATETNVVDVYIRYLRSKIDIAGQTSYIKTVRGIGYAMQE
ncbi:response regulator receiver domain protein [Streptococcus cristatus ATCC 51100]|uniref:Transcriptional regulatory protein, C-terminal domain protein n=1 Tax=Streptococcus cristatus ATCC 51100 TaxID=889201 RepID=A0AAV3EDD4_STRCR|nr:response regulator transcription factor [Streptococcus cristatus]EFX52880.1 response regulator receiver domain protein [Streptococcus cristatus ATCC 51100]EGU66829.1 transcriptional regulatory protein, C-terminal domain protein [Streptococcus cristatus ATCC 51100]KJQ57502.1 DNA-binding response regulator [Streptococcus cristatus]SQG31828.1 DNA-binding response regulator [Streptococcus cristatus ATCC 51100]